MLAELGLRVDPVSTQIVQRDRHAAFLAAIAILGGSLERLATEVRNLQHTEIAEVMEPFRQGQKGSSAMPHKRNPILSERIAGLARLLRGYAQTGLENQPLWHERDISHSSAERVVAARRDDPARLHAGPDRRRSSRASSFGRSGCARTSSAASGCTRRRGCWWPSSSAAACRARTPTAIVQRNALRAADERVPLQRLLSTDPSVAQKLPLADLDACFDDATLLRHVPEVIARLDASSASGGASVRLAEAFVRVGQGPRPVPRRRRPAAAGRVGPAVGVRRRPAHARSPTRAAC